MHFVTGPACGGEVVLDHGLAGALHPQLVFPPRGVGGDAANDALHQVAPLAANARGRNRRGWCDSQQGILPQNGPGNSHGDQRGMADQKVL